MTDREIYEQVRGPLMRFAAFLVGPDAASDLVSEVMLATVQRRRLWRWQAEARIVDVAAVTDDFVAVSIGDGGSERSVVLIPREQG